MQKKVWAQSSWGLGVGLSIWGGGYQFKNATILNGAYWKVNFSLLFWLPSEEGATLKGKNLLLLPVGAKSFLFE